MVGWQQIQTPALFHLFIACEGCPQAYNTSFIIMNNRTYETPTAELLEVKVEKGFATSGDGDNWNNVNPWS